MKKYNELKKKYDDLIKQSLEKNKKILIESFVEYYGEEFRYIIEKRYDEITFIYYIDWSMIDFVINNFIPQVNDKAKYADFINFSNCRKKSLLSKIFKSQKKQNNLPDNLIGMTNPSIVNDDYIVTWLFASLRKSNPRSFNYRSGENIERLVCFQILTLSEDVIIHEINHAITHDDIAYISEDNALIAPVSKAGLSIKVNYQHKDEKIIEELLNEKESVEIEKIFKSKGGDFSDFCLNIPLIVSIYKYNFYLIDDFYTHFKKYIKIARIGNDKNTLISRVEKKEYEEFVKLVNKYYTVDMSQIESHKKSSLPIIRKLVEKMNKNIESSHTYSKDETNAYLEQLLKAGYNLRMINDDALNNESEDYIYESKNGMRRK